MAGDEAEELLNGYLDRRLAGSGEAPERFLAAHLERFEGLRAGRVAESIAHYAGGRR